MIRKRGSDEQTAQFLTVNIEDPHVARFVGRDERQHDRCAVGGKSRTERAHRVGEHGDAARWQRHVANECERRRVAQLQSVVAVDVRSQQHEPTARIDVEHRVVCCRRLLERPAACLGLEQAWREELTSFVARKPKI